MILHISDALGAIRDCQCDDLLSTKSDGIQIFDVTNGLFSDIIAVFPDKVTSISKSVTSGGELVSNVITKDIQLCLYLRRARQGVGDAKFGGVCARQICVCCVDHILGKFDNFSPSIESLQQLTANKLQVTAFVSVETCVDRNVVVTTFFEVLDNSRDDVVSGISDADIGATVVCSRSVIARNNKVRVMCLHDSDCFFGNPTSVEGNHVSSISVDLVAKINLFNSDTLVSVIDSAK